MYILISLLIIFLIVLAVITVLGHAIWLLCAAIIHSFSSGAKPTKETILGWRCEACRSEVRASWGFCGNCLVSEPASQRLKDLRITEHQIGELYRSLKIDHKTFAELGRVINAERIQLTAPEKSDSRAVDTQSANELHPSQELNEKRFPPVAVPSFLDEKDSTNIESVPTFFSDAIDPEANETTFAPPPRPPRRSFSEMLNSFMEESNIRWGEIIGGLLIIGCSTALVVSLWSQISQIPVLKFLIFTTVTAVLFGIGIYTEHRWKLPTTSRGILTIATLLVPLNFLAIAAVSSSDTAGTLVLTSELLAPAIFLCLVYFAGRIITPGCAHLLSAGILGSSVGQLLVRHLAAADASPGLLVFLGAFPVACYVVSVGLGLRFVLKDRTIDAKETATVFTILGTMSFAALLPFGLLLYKSGPLGMSMMYLAPLVTLWGVPMLATGTVLWRRIQDKSLIASRTIGTALAILGLMIGLAGMILAWPNPASIVPAALLNFAILTALAVVLEMPVAHIVASGCFGLAYLVLFHVVAGHVDWQNLRVTSLVTTCLNITSGQALIGAFGILLIGSEWWKQHRRDQDSRYYLIAACLIAVISLTTITAFGPLAGSELKSIWICYSLYSVAAFWIAWRQKLLLFSWLGSGLLLFALASQFAWNTEYSFPWQTALLVHASLCAVVAILCSRRASVNIFSKPLNYSALISSILAGLSLLQTNPWQVTSMQAERVFWMAGIWLLSLWLNRRRPLFHAFQVALIGAVILTVKATLQQYEWYTYLPHAFLHPWGLQIQGTMLALLSLMWISVRALVKRIKPTSSFAGLLETRYSIDRLIPWVLVAGLVLLSIYGASSGVTQEFALRGTEPNGWNIAGFPHNEAFAIGSWIILGLLMVTMLASAWQQRRSVYLLGALLVVSTAIPLLAGRFESELATATAWRFLTTAFLVAGSTLLWTRTRVGRLLKSFGWPALDFETEKLARVVQTLLLSLTVGPLLLFTLYPVQRAFVLAPVQVPSHGVFALLNNNLSYVLPLIVVALVLIGYAIRERILEFSFYAGLFCNAAVTLAYLLSVVSVDAPLDSVVAVRVIQLNAIACAVYALAWFSLRTRWSQVLRQRTAQADSLLMLEVMLAASFSVGLIVPLAFALIFEVPGAATTAAGGWLGWFAFGIAAIAILLVKRSRSERIGPVVLAIGLMSFVCLTSFGFSNSGNFVALRVLTAGTTAVALLMFGASFLSIFATDEEPTSYLLRTLRLDERWSASALALSATVGMLATLLSLKLLTVLDSADYWLSIGVFVMVSVLAGGLQYTTLKRGYLYAAGLLVNLAVSIWWIAYPGSNTSTPAHLLEINIVASSTAALVWLWLELRARRLQQGQEKHGLSYHNLIALSAVIALFALTWLQFVDPPAQFVSTNFSGLAWLAWLSTALLLFATFWDQRAKNSTFGLYALGLIAGGILLEQLYLPTDKQAWFAMMFLAFYALGTTLLWRKRSNLIALAGRWGIVARIDSSVTHLRWISSATILAVLAVVSIGYWGDLRFLSFALRFSAATAVLSQSMTFGLLAEGAWQEKWQRSALAAFFIGVVLLGWSWLTPYVDATWLNRSVILVVEVLSLTALYGLALDWIRRVHADWTEALRSCIPALLSTGLVALVFCLGTEVFYQVNFGSVIINPVALLAITVTLLAAVVIPVLFALSPSHDPLGLTERGRMNYVYVGEVMLALLFLHIRLTMPWLFHGFFEDYWPIVLMAIAYLGVIASESLRRRQLFVLAKPIERTGAFLPLLPVIGFWLATSQVDYSSLLFVVGGLYGLLSILRRSFVFGALAAIAGNAGLWYMLQRTDDYQFLQHPQLWLIPVAVSVLLAAYLNEDKLEEEQLAGVRYLSLVTIYASSTADIFINGVANSPWLPLILGAFSLAGVFSGIMFKIRGLLLLGSVFLLLSIVTMIWYASANLGWTWLWYVAGIVTGATIIFMFAVFEKKRSEVLRVVEGLKDWEV